ncbi:MAG: rod shape determining protein RodA [Candidatus Azotimanducaceae bacterium]|jgi:rod shape determining protein RodA
MQRINVSVKNMDWVLISLFLVLITLGWLSIYASVYNVEHDSVFDTSQRYGKQMTWILTSLGIVFIMFIVDGTFFNKFAIPIYVIMILVLIAVLLFGKEVAGSKSWFQIGGFSIQPSEFAKFGTALAIAKVLSVLNVSLQEFRMKILCVVIIGLPAFLILLQNDTGSALVYGSFLLVLHREGLPSTLISIGFSLMLLFVLALLIPKLTLILILMAISVALFILFNKTKKNITRLIIGFVASIAVISSVDYVYQNVLEIHQRTRINVLLGKESDPHGVEYNTIQSKIAIGSGGLTGKGFLQGTQTKFNFVPEQSTDFIFCTVGEEWGFMGSLFVIALFIALIWRIIFIAERQRSEFTRIYGYSVAAIIFFHMAINIAMTIGLAPVIGIPLPFFSYGGSSLWSFTILLFIFIRLDAYRMEILR